MERGGIRPLSRTTTAEPTETAVTITSARLGNRTQAWDGPCVLNRNELVDMRWGQLLDLILAES